MLKFTHTKYTHLKGRFRTLNWICYAFHGIHESYIHKYKYIFNFGFKGEWGDKTVPLEHFCTLLLIFVIGCFPILLVLAFSYLGK